MFTLNQNVRTKLIGEPKDVKIIALIDIELYEKLCKQSKESLKENYKIWTDHYPDWTNKPIACIKSNIPYKACTLDEALSCGGTKEDWENMRETDMFYHPTDDLEAVDQ